MAKCCPNVVVVVGAAAVEAPATRWDASALPLMLGAIYQRILLSVFVGIAAAVVVVVDVAVVVIAVVGVLVVAVVVGIAFLIVAA